MTSEATDYFINITDDPCEFMVIHIIVHVFIMDDVLKFWLTREVTFTC